MSSLRRDIREFLERVSDDAEREVLIQGMLLYSEAARECVEEGKYDRLWAEIRAVSQGQPVEGKGRPEKPLLYFVRTKERDVYRPRRRMSNSNFNQYIVRCNKRLVKNRDHAKETVDENVERYGRSAELFLVGRALEDEHLPVVRIEPVNQDKLDAIYPPDNGDEDEDSGD